MAQALPPNTTNPLSSGSQVGVNQPRLGGPDAVQMHRGMNGGGGGEASYAPDAPGARLVFPAQMGYAGSVAAPYGSSSLSGANPAPPSAHSPPAAPLKRKPSDGPSPGPSARKRRAGVPAQGDPALQGEDWSGEDAGEHEERDVGPNGGPKHWTDQEKNKLFRWMLCDDQHWDLFRSKMNTVFRDASKQLFGGRKSFTALKSCYHRNVDTFKQIFAYEAFLARPTTDADGTATPAVQERFDSPLARQTYLEQRLEAARAEGVPVANLTLKVIDHWHLQGWYTLFKARFREDPHTGVPVPYYGPVTSVSFPAHAPAESPVFSIDPLLVASGCALAHGPALSPHEEAGGSAPAPAQPVPAPTASTSDVSLIPPPFLGQRTHGFKRASKPVPAPAAASHPARQATPLAPAGPEEPDVQHELPLPLPHPQPAERLAVVAEALLEACHEMMRLLREQAEERRARLAAPAREDGFNRKEKAALATDVLVNPDVGEEVRKAAADYLKRLFMSE